MARSSLVCSIWQRYDFIPNIWCYQPEKSADPDFIKLWFLDDSNKTGCRFAIVDAKNEPNILRFYEHNKFKTLFSREIDEDLYTKPPKDEAEQATRRQNPRKLRTRLMFCDLLDE